MTRIGVALLVVLWAGLALAGDFDAKKATALWYESNLQCRQGETLEGPISTEESDKQKVTIGGTITEARRITTKKGDTMCVVRLEDMYGTIGVTIFPRAYEQYQDMLEEGMVIIVRGEVQVRRDEPGILCNSIETLKSVEEEMNRKHYQVWLTLERTGNDDLSVSNDILKVQDMYRFIQERPGRDHYEVLLTGDGWHMRLTPSDNTMHYTDELRTRLEELLGSGKVEAQVIDM